METKRQNPTLIRMLIGTTIASIVGGFFLFLIFGNGMMIFAAIVIGAAIWGGFYLRSGYKIEPSEGASERGDKWKKFAGEQADSEKVE